MRKANTEHLDMHCQALAKPHSSTRTCQGELCRVHQSPPQHEPGKSCLETGKGSLGMTRVLGSFFSLSSAKPSVLGDRSKGSNESWILDPVKSRLITREVSAGHFQDENCCQIMFPVKVCQTGQTSWIQVISGHSDSLDQSSTELLSEHQAFCLHLTHLTVVAAPARVQEDKIHQCRRGQHWELPNELEFPPGSKLFKDPQV